MPNYFIINVISNIAQLLSILILIRVLISWFNINSYNQYIRLLYTFTEPILAPFRNMLSPFNIGIDFSPMIAIIAINWIRNILIKILIQM